MPKPKMRGGAKPRNIKKTFKRIVSLLKPYRVLFIIVTVCIMLGSIISVAGTFFIRTAIDDFIEVANPDVQKFATALITMGCIFLAGALTSFAYSRIMLNITAGTMNRVRIDLFAHMQKLPIKYYDNHTHGELMSRFTNDTDTMREMLSNAIPQLINSIITLVAVITGMIIFSPILTALVFLVIIVMVTFVGKIGKISGKYFVKQQKSLGEVDGYIEELITGQKVVKVFCFEDSVKESFGKITEELRHNATTASTCANILMPIMGNLSHILYALIAIVGSLFAINTQLGIPMTTGTLITFLLLTRTVSNPITQIGQQFNNVLVALAGAERIFEVMDEQEEADDGYVTLVNAVQDENGNITETAQRTGLWAWKHPHQADGTITYKLLEGKVTFNNVVFGYEENKNVLRNISLYARPGQKVAFVGSTGAGKTTITNLINRFYDVPDGKIRYDDININKIKKADLRSSLGMVLQDTNLFTGTVMDNIRYGKPEATEQECIDAAVLANADSFITRLPEGYNTPIVANGANLSQGQRQLLSIARAAIADPPVLILDEATSSIDTRTEKLIEKGMDKLMEGRTTFVIAHRLSTIRNADAIMVLENGEIIERGDHESLVKERGKYYELYTGLLELS
ncbi:MAG TPA: ABC transporter ATP-binding protein [Clostridia bacterium]|nr:ABC transporter ATP-binding protein [Clostridia bacterium]